MISSKEIGEVCFSYYITILVLKGNQTQGREFQIISFLVIKILWEDVWMKEIAKNLKLSRWWLHLSKYKEYKANMKKGKTIMDVYLLKSTISHMFWSKI